MNLIGSLRNLLGVLSTDLRCSRRGVPLGWVTRQYVRTRLAARNGRPAPPATLRCRVAGRPLELEMSAAHYGVVGGVIGHGEYDLDGILPHPPDRVIDLGANVGITAAVLAARCPNARLMCVEPDPANVSRLRSNIARNQLAVQILPTAIGPTAGTLRLSLAHDSAMNTAVDELTFGTTQAIEVPVTTVPDVMAEAGWDRVGLVKIDIEGYEVALLQSNNQWLHRVEALLIEIHANTSEAEIAGLLGPFGFALTRLHRGTDPIYLARRAG